jgi:hypothetical protein
VSAPETFPLTPDGVTAALTALGNDPEHIRQTLSAGGFKGVRDDEDSCVVATYLRAVLPPVEDVYVWQGGAWVEWTIPDPNGLDTDRQHFDWHPTPSFAAFIEHFDKGEYPDLIEESETNA